MFGLMHPAASIEIYLFGGGERGGWRNFVPRMEGMKQGPKPETRRGGVLRRGQRAPSTTARGYGSILSSVFFLGGHLRGKVRG